MEKKQKILWLSANRALYKRKSMIDGGWIGSLQKELVSENLTLALAFQYTKNDPPLFDDGVYYYPIYVPKWKKIIFHFNRKYIDKLYLQKLINVVNEFKPDIIHCWGSEQWYGLISLKVNVPIILNIQGILTPIMNSFFPNGVSLFSIFKAHKWNLFRLLVVYDGYLIMKYHDKEREQLIMRNIKYFIGRTEWDYIVTKMLSPNSKYFYCSEILRPEVINASKWSYHEDNKIIKICSTMLPSTYKGLDVILETANLLTNLGQKFEWKVLGVSKDEMLIFENLENIKSDKVSVKCCGKVDVNNLILMLLESDMYVHPSYIDNSPNSICEAQYLGVPVIGTYVGGIPTLLQNGAGILVPPKDPYQIAYHIINLKENFETALKISNKEIDIAEKRHNKKTIIEDILNIYSHVK